MKRVVVKALFFAAGFALFFAMISAYHEFRLRQPDDVFQQVARFRSPAVQPVVLILGDSRLAMDIKQEQLPAGVYNFSYPGETLRQTFLKAKFALETKPSIRYLAIGLEDLTLSSPRAREMDVSRQMLFADLEGLAQVYPASPRFLLRAVALHYVPLINAHERRRTAEALLQDVLRIAGYQPPQGAAELTPCGGFRFTEPRRLSDKPPQVRAEMARERAEMLLSDSNDDPELRRVFRELLELAEDHRVKVIGLRSPVLQEYRQAAQAYDTQSARRFFANQPLLTMLDYETLLESRSEYFFDPDHLNSDGARAFTERLVQDLQSIAAVNAAEMRPCALIKAETTPWPYNNLISGLLRPAVPPTLVPAVHRAS